MTQTVTAQVISRTAARTRVGIAAIHTRKLRHTAQKHWPRARFVHRAGHGQETGVFSSTELGNEALGRNGAGSEAHGSLSSSDPLEVSQQTRGFAPVEGDQEAALCQGTGWDHETREDPPVPKGQVGKGVIPFIFHEGRTRHREGQSFIQGT